MPRATRVVLAPPEPWAEEALVDAARALALPDAALAPGDEVHGLVVHRVEPHAGAHGDARAVIEVVPHVARAKPRGGHHVLVLIDASASMGQPWSDTLTRLEAARHALGGFLKNAPGAATKVTLLSFARDLRVLAGPAPPARLARPDARAVTAGGPCRMGGAIDLALGRIAPDQRAAIVLVADSSGEATEVAAAASRANRLGVPVHVLALAPDVDPALDALARDTGGVLAHARDVPTLEPVTAALAAAVGAPHAWEEPRVPKPGERAYDDLVGPELDALQKLGLRKEKT